MKLTVSKLWLLIGWLSVSLAAIAGPASTPALSNTVAVLDFTGDNLAGENWTVGLNDFLEVALQKEGVATLERRQIRLILNEREVQQHLVVNATDWRAAKLPGVTYFVSGNVKRTAPNRFELTVSVTHARTAIVKATLTKRGVYSTDWLDAIQSLAREIGKQVRTQSALPRARNDAESLTWLPEAAMPFFKGLEYYSRGDYPMAIPYFRAASGKAGQFDQARLWEIRTYRQLGFTELAEFVSKHMLQKPAPGTSMAEKLPVVAVVASESISEPERARFTQRIKQSGKYALLDPAAIAATTREIDLQLTGQMAAPLNGRSVWLAIDSTIALSTNEATLNARQRDLISGELICQASVPISTKKADAFERLADAFLRIKSHKKPLREDVAAQELKEPDSHDTPESMFAKLLRLVKAHPENARYWVALADDYGDWDSKMWILDKAIQAVERDKTQPDAPFLLASALWRKREISSWAWFYSHSWSYAEHPVTNDFAKLLEWFPNSSEATAALEEYIPKGAAPHPQPKQGRFAGSVFTNISVGLIPLQDAQTPVLEMTEQQKLARLKELRANGRNAKAYELADALLVAKDPAIRETARQEFDALFKQVQEETREIAEFNRAVDKGENETALRLGQRLSDCILRKERLAFIRRCGPLLKQSQGWEAYAHFVCEQAEKYSEDFDVDPVTGARKTKRIDFDAAVGPDYTVPGHPIRPQRWTSSGMDMDYASLMGDLADELQAASRPDLCARVYESMSHNKSLPLRNRLTATYDLAQAEYQQGKAFEALELLKELLQQTEGADVPIARKNFWSSDQVYGVAFDLLRKIRLFTDEDTDFTKCCGEPIPIPAPDSDKIKAMDQLFTQLWNSYKGGVGGDNRSVRQILLEKKKEALPVLLYKIWKGDEAKQMLIFCGELGTNAAAAVPYLPKYICYNNSFPEYNNALLTFGRIGKPAACAVPFLILAAEGTTSVFNAEFSLRAVGPAPKRVMPYLAKLLYHQNPGVCRRAADAMIKSAGLDAKQFSGPDLLGTLRKWWEDEGSKQEWKD